MRRLALVVTVGMLLGLASPARPSTGDPLQAQQWGLAKVEAPAAWSFATGVDIRVAVVDTGVDSAHPELAGKLEGGASWLDCGRQVPRPCTTNPEAPPSQDGAPPWDDRHGHGTHVAGIAAAPLDDLGVAGVAPAARIMPIRVLDEDGFGESADVAAGIRYAADNGAHVINLSLGDLPVVAQLFDSSGLDPEFAQAIAYAVEKGVLVVAAAGNEAFPLCDSESFARANAVCVGATDRRDLKAAYSNFGGGLDVVAPGGAATVFCDPVEDVLSTFALDQRSSCESRFAGPGYETLAGTSMATPHVAGVGALLAQLGITGSRAANCLRATADDLGTPGPDSVFGSGRVNARKAVTSSTC